MADKEKTEKKAKDKGSPFSSISGAFDAANDATMALGPLTGLAREDFIGAIGLMLRQLLPALIFLSEVQTVYIK